MECEKVIDMAAILLQRQSSTRNTTEIFRSFLFGPESKEGNQKKIVSSRTLVPLSRITSLSMLFLVFLLPAAHQLQWVLL
jgi:hypothetical protein